MSCRRATVEGAREGGGGDGVIGYIMVAISFLAGLNFFNFGL